MPVENKVQITFMSNVNRNVVTDYSLRIIEQLGEASENFNLIISSTLRTPHDQARIMFANCKNLGVASQHKLYGRNGDLVIDVFETETKAAGYSEDLVIRKMLEKIIEIGPGNVSHHCADPSVLNVIDIPFSCLSDINKFREKLKDIQAISKYFDEPANHCFHIEIPQK